MHDRKLIRLQGFRYSSNRYYFVSICVDHRIKSFGLIANKIMQMSDCGIIASEQLNWLASQYPYIKIISSVIMPNHVHAIIYTNPNYYYDLGDGTNPYPQDQKNNSDKIKPLPELIGAYKTTVSKRIHLGGDIWFKWQKSYYDHIIRNAMDLARIKKYIEENPENWETDSFNK